MLKFFKRIAGIANRRHSTRVQLLAALECNAELAEENYRLRTEQSGLWDANKELADGNKWLREQRAHVTVELARVSIENEKLREMLSAQIRETEKSVAQGMQLSEENRWLHAERDHAFSICSELVAHKHSICELFSMHQPPDTVARARIDRIYKRLRADVSPCKCDICDNSSE